MIRIFKLYHLILLTLTFTAIAGNAENVIITKLGSGPVYESICGVTCIPVKVTPQHSNFANCSKNGASWDFALNTSTESGKQAYSHILAMYMSGKAVSIYGKGTCMGDYEEINFIISKE